MSFTNYLEGKILDHVFRGVTYTPPAGVYVALFSVAPSETGGGTEVTGGSYARQQVTYGAASGTGQIANTAAVSFTNMPATDVLAVGIMDAATAGNLLSYKVLSPSKSYVAGENVTIAIGDLIQTLD